MGSMGIEGHVYNIYKYIYTHICACVCACVCLWMRERLILSELNAGMQKANEWVNVTSGYECGVGCWCVRAYF